MNIFSRNTLWLVALLAQSCANKGFPEGGPKDVTPPVVTEERPASFSIDFAQKRLTIHFSEFVQLKDINNKFIMSPPAKKDPRISLRGRYIQVEFQDTLRQNITYSLDFADGIADNNEGNPLGFYRYVFSTGGVIDTMELAGQVIDARTRLPLLGVNVLLHANTADSAALLELPSYIARTDSAGRFRVTNIREASYRVMALEDANRDKLFMPEEERVGFLDSLVMPVVWRENRMDTIRPDTTKILVKRSKRGTFTVDTLTRDTVVEREYVMYGPANLLIVMFDEEKTQLYMTGDARPERERIDLTFSVPGENQLVATLLGDAAGKEDWYLTERSAGRDTLSLWIRDSLVYKMDSLQVELAYLYSDSTRQLVQRRDTSWFVFAEKKKETTRRRRGDDDDEPQPPPVPLLEVSVASGSPHDLNRPVILDFNKPVVAADLDHITLREKVDTTWRELPLHWRQDSLKIRRFFVEHDWRPGAEYNLKADSMAIRGIHGIHSRPLDVKFTTKELDAYGKLILHAEGVTMPVIFQLCQGDKDVKVVEERRATADGRVTFDFLKEGTYILRVVMDANGNGLWDTGNFLKHRQPEEIKYIPGEFKVRKNFDIEQDVQVNKEYTREDPAKKKEENKK
ncbi:MAG: Ig-like domain-containing protein [Odoribacteraceae bacterium]|jgi:hypothetical protein|nr:Ig-like domain-containing protein [Odoribacteraceae bacterium]